MPEGRGLRIIAAAIAAMWPAFVGLPTAQAAPSGFIVDTFATAGATSWAAPAGVRSVRVLAVGGGGGGASGCAYSGGTGDPYGGGGGAGGAGAEAFAAVSGAVPVVVGAGGPGGGAGTADQDEYGGGAGGSSSAAGIVGSGGGGGVLRCYSGAPATNGTATGAGGLGAPNATTPGGDGGAGLSSDITGASVVYGGGGGGGSAGAGTGNPGAGVTGRGGLGGDYLSPAARTDGAAGSPGVVVIRALDPGAVSPPTLMPVPDGAGANTIGYDTTDVLLSAPLTAASALAGGSADFMIGSTVIASDTSILPSDTSVEATTSLGSNAAVQAQFPAGTSSLFVRFRTGPLPNAYESETAATSISADYTRPVTPPPAAATASVDGRTVTISWLPPAGDPPLANYRVTGKDESGKAILAAGSTDLCLVTWRERRCSLTLPPGTYTFAVQAYAPSSWSVDVSTPPVTVVDAPASTVPSPIAPSPSAKPTAAPASPKPNRPNPAAPSTAPRASATPTSAESPSAVPTPPAPTPTATASVAPKPLAPPTPSAPTTPTTTQPTGVLPAEQVPPMLSLGPYPRSLPDGPLLQVDLGLEVGAPAAGASLAIESEGLKPGSTLEATVYSEPQVVGSAVAAPDGTATIDAKIPDGLEPGLHTISVVGIGPDGVRVESTAAFTIDAQGVTTGVAPAGQSTGRPSADQLERAVAARAPVYDTHLSPGTAAAIGLAVSAVPAMAGLARQRSDPAAEPSAADGPGADSVGDADAGVSNSLLDRVEPETEGPGDRSWTWRLPGTGMVDAAIASAAHWIASRSRILLRVLLDGSWSRAAFGAAGPIVLWGGGIVLGLLATFSVGFANVPAPWPILGAIVAIAILDAMAGVLAWLVGAVAAIAAGHVRSLDSARALIGTLVLYAALPLVIAGIRALRRPARMDARGIFDRGADFVMTIVLGALAGVAIVRLANALIGVEIGGPDLLWPMQLLIAAAILVRMAGEDLASHAYPGRCAAIEPHDLPDLAPWARNGAILVKVGAFVVLVSPFVGVTAASVIAGIAITMPMILDALADRLPSSAALGRWLPQSVYRSLPMVFVGTYIAAGVAILAADGSAPWVYLLLFSPALVLALLDFLGRNGPGWPDRWSLRLGGVAVWAALLPFLFGIVSLG